MIGWVIVTWVVMWIYRGSVEAYGCAPLINHKTGNSIQIMSSADAKKIAKMTQRRGYGTMLG